LVRNPENVMPLKRQPPRGADRLVARMRVAVILLGAAVAALAPGALAEVAAPPTPIVWPPPPEPARIQYLGALQGAQDLKRGKSFLRRVVEMVAGAKPQPIRQPYGVTEDADGRIYVADPAARIVHIFDQERQQYAALRGPGREGFRYPVGVSTDDRGRLFVSDAERAMVVVFDRSRRPVLTITDSLLRPAGLAFNPTNRLLYVVDVLRHRVLAYDSSGRRVLAFGTHGSGAGQLSYPTNVAVGAGGRVLVTDALNFRVQIFSPQGIYVTGFGRLGDALGDLARPKGIGVDSEGHIYVVEGLYDVVNVFDTQGRLLLSFGGPGSRPGQFWLASGLYVDRKDRIIVADCYNGRVQMFQYLKGARSEP
jgi:DNA-binding beta-propeller fold protein YncE